MHYQRHDENSTHCPGPSLPQLPSDLAVVIAPSLLPLRVSVPSSGCDIDDSCRLVVHLICSLLLLTGSIKGISLGLSRDLDLKWPMAAPVYDQFIELLYRTQILILDFRRRATFFTMHFLQCLNTGTIDSNIKEWLNAGITEPGCPGPHLDCATY